ncbi:MAG: hypothetical protein GY926_04960 [bacterium]|nr:hypothetical protein [bacterium]
MLEVDQATSLSEQLVENPGVNLAQVRRDLSYIAIHIMGRAALMVLWGVEPIYEVLQFAPQPYYTAKPATISPADVKALSPHPKCASGFFIRYSDNTDSSSGLITRFLTPWA